MSGTINPNTDATAGAVFRQAQATANRLTRANMNIPELIMAIQMERANILEQQVMDQMEDMQKRNEWLREANAALAQLRVARPNGTDEVKGYGSFTDANGNSKSVKEWMDQNGVQIENTGSDSQGKQFEFDAAIQNLKASIDTANTNSQMDMVRLQGLMDKRNQTFDLMTNTLSKTGKSMDGVVGNMR